MFRPGLVFEQRHHVYRHGQLTLKQLRLSVLNGMHTNSYTGSRLLPQGVVHNQNVGWLWIAKTMLLEWFAAQFRVYAQTIRQLSLVVCERIVNSGFAFVDYSLTDNLTPLSNC